MEKIRGNITLGYMQKKYRNSPVKMIDYFCKRFQHYYEGLKF